MYYSCKKNNKKGLCILSSEGRKREFLSDSKFLSYKGFKVADTSDCGITLMYYPLDDLQSKPRFKECAKHPMISEKGFVIFYTDQCPFSYYWVNRVEECAKENNIQLKTIHITTREEAQNISSPVTTYALFKDGNFLTQCIQSDKKFLLMSSQNV